MNIIYKGLKVVVILLILISATNIFKNFESRYNAKPFNGGIIIEQDFTVNDCSDIREYVAENNIKIYRIPSNGLEPYYYSNTSDTSTPINNNVNYNSVDYLCSDNNSGDYGIDTSESPISVEEFANYLSTTYNAQVVAYDHDETYYQTHYPSLKYVIFLIAAIIMLLLLMLLDRRDKKLKTATLYTKELKYLALSLVVYTLLFFVTDSYLSNYLFIFIIILILLTNLLIYSLCYISKKLQDKKLVTWLFLCISIISLTTLTIMFLPSLDMIVSQYKDYKYYTDNAEFYDDFYYINGMRTTTGASGEIPDYGEISMGNIEDYLISFHVDENGIVQVNENYIKYVYGEEYLGYSTYIHESNVEQYCGSDLECTDDYYIYKDDIEIKSLTESYDNSLKLINPTIVVSKNNADGNILALNDVQTIEFYNNLIAQNSVEPDNTIGLQMYTYEQNVVIKYQSLLNDIMEYLNYIFLGFMLLALSIVYFIKLNKKM